MKPKSADDTAALVKIVRLVAERGWSQEHFARLADLNRLTVRRLLQEPGAYRVRSATVSACARALGVSVHDLHTLPLENLLTRVKLQSRAGGKHTLHELYEHATQPELLAWIEANPERAGQLDRVELDELFSLQGTGGPLTELGVEHFVGVIERKRRLKEKIDVIAGTAYLDMIEQLVDLVYDKIQPYRGGTLG